MHIAIGFDTETEVTIHGAAAIPPELSHRVPNLTPVPVCGQFSFLNRHKVADDYIALLRDPYVVRNKRKVTEIVCTPADTARVLLRATRNEHTLVAHNAPFDVFTMSEQYPALLGILMEAYEKGLIRDTGDREKLYLIALGWYTFDKRTFSPPKFSLAYLANVHLGVDLTATKTDPDAWRLRYHELANIPIPQWPQAAIDYAALDATYALMVYYSQRAKLSGKSIAGTSMLQGDRHWIPTEHHQGKASAVLHLISAHGFAVDPAAVYRWKRVVEAEARKAQGFAAAAGLIRINKCKTCDGTGYLGDVPSLEKCSECLGDPLYFPVRTSNGRKMPAKSLCPLPPEKRSMKKSRLEDWIVFAYGGQPERNDPSDTEKKKAKAEGREPVGSVKCDGDALEGIDYVDRHPMLKHVYDYGQAKSAEKLLSTYLPILMEAVEGNGVVRARYDAIKRTGRTSARGPNMQNPPRAEGFRECFVSRKGKVLCSIDYTALELHTLAAVCLKIYGRSKLADALNNGLDPHVLFAVELLKLQGIQLTYEQALDAYKIYDSGGKSSLGARVADARQRAKACNFGFPGGLGAQAFRVYARKTYGVEISLGQADELKKLWYEQWPIVRKYLREYIGGFANKAGRDSDGRGNRFAMTGVGFGMVRGDCSYTSGANFSFQGLAAHGIKAAMWDLAKLMYLDEGSPLYGVRMVAMVHDELIFEGPEETREEWGQEAAKLMVDAMNRWTPGVTNKAEPEFGRRWSKKMRL